MNRQQTRIWAILGSIAAAVRETGRVPIDTQAALLAEGYDLRRLPDDIANLTQ